MTNLTDRLRNQMRSSYGDELEAADLIDAIDARHKSHDGLTGSVCDECRFDWPCPTHRLIHGDDRG